jgi:hypothetical protein
MNADAERTAGLPLEVSDGNDYGPVDSCCPGSRFYIARLIGLNITGRDRLVAFKGQTGHALSDRDQLYDFGDVRRQPDLRFQHKDSFLQQVYRAGIRIKATNYIFKFRLHESTISAARQRGQHPISHPHSQSDQERISAFIPKFNDLGPLMDWTHTHHRRMYRGHRRVGRVK